MIRFPLIFILIHFFFNGFSQDVADLKKLSIEELLDIEVTSVSKQPEKLTEAASAIQVITSEDIRRSGATNVPEALRLAPNLEVAQVNSSTWAISSRGFNNVLANKLLVLIDGRTVYTPLYAGVFWDVQNLLLEDVDRIEVISGPGGTLWGANAVNGVINIITKKSKDTKGVYAELASGTKLDYLASLRYGGKILENLNFRVYGTAFKRDNTILFDSSDANDEWSLAQGGFRFDWEPTTKDFITLQSDIYNTGSNPDGDQDVIASGDNIVGRWSHTTSEKSDYKLQIYYDHIWRNYGTGLKEKLQTYDVDWQHHIKLTKRHNLIWGAGIRLMDHNVQNLELFGFFPAHKILNLYSAFLQDEITLIEDRLLITLGSKFEHHTYTGFQVQPSGRITWTPADRHSIWSAVSRGIRTPSRLERDFLVSAAPGVPLILGNKDFKPEEMIAYELGWRVKAYQKLSVSLSAFYNVYDYIRSAESGPPPAIFSFGNGVKGQTYGIELAAIHQVAKWLHLRGGYTFLRKDLSVKPNSTDLNQATAESNDPEHQVILQSSIDLPGRFELGTVIRYIGELPKPLIPHYLGLDVRLGWKLNKYIELSVVGQNLAKENHIEYIPASPSPRKIERSVYGKISCRF